MRTDNICFSIMELEKAIDIIESDCKPNSSRYDWCQSVKRTIARANKEIDSIREQNV